MDFLTTISSVGALFLLAVPGFILAKIKLIKPEHIGVLVCVLLYVNQPFIMIDAFITKTYENSLLVNIGIVFLVGVISQIFIMFLGKLIFRADNNRLRGNAYSYASAIGNVGFMGIPVVSVLLPENAEAILYVSVFLMSFNLVAWTIGIYALTGNKKDISIKKALLNPPIIAMIVALPIFFLRVKLPSFLTLPISYLAMMNTPLAMIILGAKFAWIRLRELVSGWGVYLTCFIKLVACPLIVYGCLYPFEISRTVKIVLIILSAMPSANMVLMHAERFGGDTVAATKAVMLTTVASILTIPLIMLLPM